MKLTNKQLKQIIKEELRSVLLEADGFDDEMAPEIEKSIEKLEGMSDWAPKMVMELFGKENALNWYWSHIKMMAEQGKWGNVEKLLEKWYYTDEDLVINEEQYKIANHILKELLEPNRKYYKRYKEAGVNLLVISQNLLTQMSRWQNIRVYNPATKKYEIRPDADERENKERTYHDRRGR